MKKRCLKIPEPIIRKYPTELFGFPYTDRGIDASNALKRQYCPFLKGECNKPRKSEPEIKVGICSVGYRGDFLGDYVPIIICPYRFNIENVYNSIKNNFYGIDTNGYDIQWVNEVSLGVGGIVDYVAIKKKLFPGGLETIEDFVCVEFQAAGTTGTPWEAMQDYKRTGRYQKDSYNYGINWANEFAKTMMQQVYKKGQIMEHWNKHIIFALQDVGMDYLKSKYDVSGLRELNSDDSIYFYTFAMVWNDKRSIWDIEFKESYSTNTEGIRKILAGATSNKYPSIEEFILNIKRRISI